MPANGTVPPPSIQPPSNSGIDFGLGGTGATGQTTSGGLNGLQGQSGQIFTPQQAASGYYQQTLETQNIQSGGQVFPTSGTMSISDALREFNNMSTSELIQLETMLWQAGFYVDAQGNPLSTPPVLGSRDPQSVDALMMALEQANNTGQTIDNVIVGNIQSGAGANARRTQPQPEVGGGNTYQINLTNPEDVSQTALQIFQSALGRGPTQDELDKTVAVLQGKQTSAQESQIQQQETASQAKYQANVNARNAVVQYQTTPKVAAGAVPNGPFNSPAQWAVAQLQYMNMPVTQSNVQFLIGWANQEGGNWNNSAQYNPLNTTLGLPGSKVMAGGNSAGVQSYQSWAQGIQATASTLENYGGIMAALQSGDAVSHMGDKQVSADLQKWSGAGSYSSISNTVSQPGAYQEAQQAVQQATGSAYMNQTSSGWQGYGSPPAGANAGGAPQPQAGNYQSMPANDVNQNVASVGDQYIPSTTQTIVAAPSAGAEAWTQATTGANQIPYLGYQYLNAFNAIASMIRSGGATASGS